MAEAMQMDTYVVGQDEIEAVQTLLTDLQGKSESIPEPLQRQLAWIVRVRDAWMNIPKDDKDDPLIQAFVMLLFRTIQWYSMLMYLRWWFETAFAALQQKQSTIATTNPGIYEAMEAKRRKIVGDITGLLSAMPRGIDIPSERAGLGAVHTGGAGREEHDTADAAIQDVFPSYFAAEERNSLLTSEWYSTDMMASLVDKLIKYIKALESGYTRLRDISIKTIQTFQEQVAKAQAEASAASEKLATEQQARAEKEERLVSRKLSAVVRQVLDQPMRPVPQTPQQGDPPSTRPVWPSLQDDAEMQESNAPPETDEDMQRRNRRDATEREGDESAPRASRRTRRD